MFIVDLINRSCQQVTVKSGWFHSGVWCVYVAFVRSAGLPDSIYSNTELFQQNIAYHRVKLFRIGLRSILETWRMMLATNFARQEAKRR